MIKSTPVGDAATAQESFIAALRAAREAQGVSASALSRKVGTYRGYVTQIENRRAFPSPSRIRKFAAALGADPEEWVRIAAPLTLMIREGKTRRGRERGRANAGRSADHKELEEAQREALHARERSTDIAARVGVSLATVQRWRRQYVSPSQRNQLRREAVRATYLRRIDPMRSRLTAARADLRMNVVDLSGRSRVPASVICALETGLRSPTTTDGQWSAAARAVAGHLGFACDELWPAHAPKAPRLPAEVSPTPEELCAEKQLREWLGYAVASLSPRHALVIRMRFGLRFDDDGADLAAVAAALGGYSRERARRLECEALRMLAERLGGVL